MNIIVNAIATKGGGALSILKHFIEAIDEDENYQYWIFISEELCISCSQTNIHLIKIEINKSWIKRLYWDTYGLKKWLRQRNIIPTLSLSFQNTNFKVGYDIPNYIYYHQSIPLSPHKWSVLKKRERILWFYKYIYPFFVKLFINKKTEFFVQLNCIRQQFSEFYNVPLSKIHVVSPDFNMPVLNTEEFKCKWNDNKIHIFYPANTGVYKNHEIILRALQKINSKIVLHLTCLEKDLKFDCSGVDVDFLGYQSFEQVLSIYKEIDALVFPSFIETFGLPLLEAASLGIPIIVADLAYAREVLKGYEGATFVKYDDEKAWRTTISQIKPKERFDHYVVPFESGWKKLFQIILK